MFLSAFWPRSTNSCSSFSRTCPYASSDKHTPPGGDPFQSGGDIDAIAHQIAIAFLDYIAQMDANTKLNAALGR